MDIATLGIAVDSRQSDQAGKSLDNLANSAGKAENATKKMGKEAAAAAREAAKETREFERAMADAATKGVVIGQAISEGIRIAVRAVGELDRMIREVGDLKDLAEMTGASAAGFSRMRLAADVAGLSMERVSNIALSITRQLSAVSDESKNAGKALGVLGIPLEEFRRLRPDERIFKLSEALSQVNDSGGKTALILDIAGRGSADAAKLFNALADEANRLDGYTEALIDQMDEYADANTRAGAKTRFVVEMLALEMAPAFAAAKGAVKDTIVALFDMGKESTALGNNKGALEFAHAVGLGVAHIIDVAVKGVMWLTALGKTIGALAAAGGALLSGQGLSGVRAIFEGLNEDITSLQKRYANIDTAGAFEKRFQEIVAGEKKITASVDRELQNRVDAYKRANDKVSKADKEAQREKERDERERIRLGRRMAIEQGEAVLKANEEFQKKLEEQRKAQADLDSKNLQNSQDEINAINEAADALNEKNRTRKMLLSAIESEKLALMEKDRVEFEGNETALAQLDKKIEAQKKYIAALKSDETIRASEEVAAKSVEVWDRAWQQVGQSLADEIVRGGMSAKDMLENAFRAMILRPTMNALVGDALGISSGVPGTSNLGLLFQSGYGLSMANKFGTGVANATGTGIDGLLATNGAYGTAPSSFSFGQALPYIGALIQAKNGNYGSAAGMAIGTAIMPGIGTIIGGALGGMFDGKGGGPMKEGRAGLSAGVGVGPNTHELDSLAQSTVKNLNDTYARLATMLGATDRTMKFGVGMSMDPEGDGQSAFDLVAGRGGSYKSRSAGRTMEELQKALAEGSAEMLVDALKSSGIDQEMSAYMEKVTQGMTGEAKLGAIQAAIAMKGMRDSLNDLSKVTVGVGNISLDATDKIAQFAGGIENLASGMQAYAQNFLTQGEQRDFALEQISRSMRASGVMDWATADVLKTWDRGTFRNMVESLDLTTETGQRAYASLMNVAGAFASVTEGSDASSKASQAAAEAARQFAEEVNSLRAFGRSQGFTNIQALSDGAAKALADMAGGIDTLKGQLEGFNQNFMTSEQRRQLTLVSLAEAFGRAGVSQYDSFGEVSNMTRQQYAQMVKAANLNTEAGRRLYVELMNLSGAFVSITDAIKEPDFYTLDEAYQTLNDAYSRQKDELNGVVNAMEAASKGYKDFIASLKTDQGLSNLSPAERMTELQQQYERALVEADRDNNSPEAMQRLTGAARAMLEGARGFYGSGTGYDAIYERVIKEMERRAESTGKAGSIAEQQLAKLDQQVRGLIDINKTLISVDQGIRILQLVKSGEKITQVSGYPHATGLERVPYDNYPALLHKDERVLTASESSFMRQAPNIVAELTALRAEVVRLRKENRQDAGNTIGATIQAAQDAARLQAEATLRAATQREYQTRNRPALA